jgi:hypothetical protein
MFNPWDGRTLSGVDPETGIEWALNERTGEPYILNGRDP